LSIIENQVKNDMTKITNMDIYHFLS